jgi:hypothetical protein
MNALEAEAKIRETLDGWFFRMTTTRGPEATPMVRAIEVEKDYIPEHRPEWDYLMDDSKPHHNAAVFSPEEDDIILTMRASGSRWADVGKSLGRCIHAIRDRYKVLCLERGIEPIERIAPTGPPSKFSDSDKMRMLSMRDRGMSYDKIAAKFGCSRWSVADTISKFRRKMRAAA